jgi:LemA protein
MPTALLVLLAAFAFGATWVFNRLVGLRNRARGAWSDIDVQLERRHDLVGNLVEVVEGYALHERRTLERVTEARARAEGMRREGGPAGAASSENGLSDELRSLFAVAEAYPDLKASDRFLDLQRALVELEDALQNARRYYNAVVRDLNTRIQSFPDLLVARPLGFEEREFFRLDDATEAAAPRLDLGSRGVGGGDP